MESTLKPAARSKITQISESLHAGLDDIDKLQISNLARAQELLAFRIESGMTARDGERGLKRQIDLISDLQGYRSRYVLAHIAVQADAEKMDFPTDCPPSASGAPAKLAETTEA